MNCLLVATRKGLFTLERNGSPRWSIQRLGFLGDNVSMVLPDGRDGTVYAALEHGHFGCKFHRSRDGGQTWEECAAPAYPRQEGQPELDMWGRPIPQKLIRVWALEAGHPSQPGVLWCGTIPGGLFRSGDHGSTWELVRTLWDHPQRKQWMGGGADWPGIHSICVHPNDPRHVTVGVSCGGAWVTTDGGQTWNCRSEGMTYGLAFPPEQRSNPTTQDPHRIVQCPAAPETLWAQHHSGIFRSTNGAASWQEITGIEPSTFGFAVAVHPHDPKTAWFVPAIKDERRIPVQGSVVVARTRDGGRTSEVLRNGLPQEYAYDLTYRHGLDVDDRGQSLAFGSTTGALWATDDQGDSWNCLSEHLPPIHCVRFAN